MIEDLAAILGMVALSAEESTSHTPLRNRTRVLGPAILTVSHESMDLEVFVLCVHGLTECADPEKPYHKNAFIRSINALRPRVSWHQGDIRDTMFCPA